MKTKFKVGDLVEIIRMDHDDDKMFSLGDRGRVYYISSTHCTMELDFNDCGNKKIKRHGQWCVLTNQIKLVREKSAVKRTPRRKKIVDTRSEEDKVLCELILG